MQIYTRQRDARGPGRIEGRLLCDECELRHGFVMNSKNQQIYGQVQERSYDIQQAFNKIQKTVENNTGSENQAKDHGITLVKKVLQYRYQPLIGKGFSCEFEYNDGTLSSSSLLKSINRVIMSLEMNDFGVLGVCMDAGGPDKGLYYMLCDPKNISKADWINGQDVSFSVPFVLLAIVFILCATHGSKGMRNGILNSYESAANKKAIRKMKNAHGVCIRWLIIIKWYNEDKSLTIGDTDMNEASAYPNKWSKMNVSNAKAPFTRKTRTAVLLKLARRLNCVNEISILKRPNIQGRLTIYEIEQVNKLKEFATRKGFGVDSPTTEEIATLELCIHIGLIFNDALMNSKNNDIGVC